MFLKVKIGISNHHVHLTKETYEMLFDEEMQIKKELTQTGEFASFQCVTLKNKDKVIENVRVLGPFRDYNQIEISKSDAYFLGLNPQVRASGDLVGTSSITLLTSKGEVTLNEGCILAQRHIHLSPTDAKKYGLSNHEKLLVKINNERGAILETYTKISANGVLEMHIDRDEANALLLNNGDELTIEL